MEEAEKQPIVKCICCDLHRAVKEDHCDACWCWKSVLKKYTNIYK